MLKLIRLLPTARPGVSAKFVAWGGAAGALFAAPAAATLLTAIAKLATRVVSCPVGQPVVCWMMSFLPWCDFFFVEYKFDGG